MVKETPLPDTATIYIYIYMYKYIYVVGERGGGESEREKLTGTGTTANIIRGESSHRRVKGFILLSVRDEFVFAVK